MKAIGKYVVVNKINEEIKTDMGLTLTGKMTDHIRYKKGIVVNPGTDVNTLIEDDIIYYDAHAGHTMMIDGHEYTIILERDVVVVE
jgi:co-chaperonin GroES (HSP10)|tara:strand:- start:365 stop:622 length:258 start_codon:yes stop_codon:yes gene_type:complete